MNTVSVDLKNATNNGQLLWHWLSQFWHRVYQNPEFAKNIQYGQGLLSIQLYLDFIESLSRINRNSVPVFHRERWKPVRLLKSQAGTGDAALIRLGVEPPAVIGPQTTSYYVKGATFPIGGTSELSASISYPLTGIVGGPACICDSIIGPKSVLLAGTDFVVEDSTVFFLRERDPFNNSAFPTRKVQNSDGSVDDELIIWCLDTLEERDYIYTQIGYVLDIHMESSELYLNMVNRLWDLYNFGTPVQRLQACLGAILDEPTVGSTQETVVQVLADDAGTQVVTDVAVYRLSPTATLRSEIIPGAVLHQGDYFTETIRLYSNINPLRLTASGEYGVRFRTDVPAMFFGVDMFRTKLRYGLGASWDITDIVSTGLDANGNPKLKFQLFGTPEDIDVFWQDFWAYCELQGISSATCFSDYLDPEAGKTYGRVAPLEYFLRYFLRANLCVVALDFDALTDAGKANIRQLHLLQSVLPAHILMTVTLERHIEDVRYSMGDAIETTTAMETLVKTDTARPGGPSSLSLTYRDRCPILRWIPTCGRRA